MHCSIRCTDTCFNPRSRAGSDSATMSYSTAIEHVSIHAPARGATDTVHDHRPVTASFNPRSRAGSDSASACIEDDVIDVSIHAPARGATIDMAATADTDTCFNPRSRAGSDTRLPNACRQRLQVQCPAKVLVWLFSTFNQQSPDLITR